jgi:hypothetical protein
MQDLSNPWPQAILSCYADDRLSPEPIQKPMAHLSIQTTAMTNSNLASKITKLADPEPGTGGRQLPLHCRPPQTKTECRPRTTASEFWRWANDKIELAPAMTAMEKTVQFDCVRRPTAYAADLSQTFQPPMSAI